MPIRMQVPTMRFRTEMLSWGYTDTAGTTTNYPNYLAWLRKVIEEGMATEARLWGSIQVYLAARALGYTATVPASIVEWIATFDACGAIAWPPVPTSSSPTVTPIPSVAELIHQVGFHWYHDTNVTLEGLPPSVPGYADTAHMAQDVADMVSVVTGPLRSVGGIRLGITAGEIGFPGLDPGPWTSDLSVERSAWGSYYEGASPELQAAMHLRYLLTLLASGVDSASIFTFSHGDLESDGTFATTPGASLVHSWTDFATTGLHNEVVYAPATGDPVQGVDAWPRPSWYSFRRLAWLLEHAGATPTSRVQIVANSDGLMVVELLFASPRYLSLSPLETWSRAYFVWIDQYSTAATTASVTFEDPALSGFTLLPMVPTVTPPTSSTPEVNRNGYALPSAVEWEAAGWDSALVTAARSGSGEPFHPAVFSLLVQRTVVELASSGRTSIAIAPLCVLTNANFTGFTWTTP